MKPYEAQIAECSRITDRGDALTPCDRAAAPCTRWRAAKTLASGGIASMPSAQELAQTSFPAVQPHTLEALAREQTLLESTRLEGILLESILLTALAAGVAG